MQWHPLTSAAPCCIIGYRVNTPVGCFASLRALISVASGCRLHMLEAQCAAWGGVTSAAVYWPLLLVDRKPAANAGDVRLAKEAIHALHERMDAGSATQATAELLMHVFDCAPSFSFRLLPE